MRDADLMGRAPTLNAAASCRQASLSPATAAHRPALRSSRPLSSGSLLLRAPHLVQQIDLDALDLQQAPPLMRQLVVDLLMQLA